jgi:hypothetical protein
MFKQLHLATIAVVTTLLVTGCSQFTTGGNSVSDNTQPSYERSISFASSRPATGNNVFIFDPKQAAWAAYDTAGFKVAEGPASGGKDYCADIGRACKTPVGSFRVFRKKGAECESSIYPIGEGGAKMPYCSFFHGGYAIHGSYHVPNYNASHGCIRVQPGDAQWLSENFLNYGTTVIVRPYY